MSTLNIYCDESAHLENDGLRWMVLGAVWLPAERVRETAVRLREIKVRHGLWRDFEVKWGKVSPARLPFYMDVLDYFLDDDDLAFRGVIADKRQLDHGSFEQTHDDWYYKMWWVLLNHLISPDTRHRIYIDIKDTRSQSKVEKLREVLCNGRYDFQGRLIERIQHVRSNEVEHIQLADLLAGIVAGANRGDIENPAKLALIARLKERTRLTLVRNTLISARKVNLLQWVGRSR